MSNLSPGWKRGPRVSGPRSSGPSPGTSLSGQGRRGWAGAGLTRLETDGGNGWCLGGLADKGTPPPGLTLLTSASKRSIQRFVITDTRQGLDY